MGTGTTLHPYGCRIRNDFSFRSFWKYLGDLCSVLRPIEKLCNVPVSAKYGLGGPFVSSRLFAVRDRSLFHKSMAAEYFLV